MKPQISRLEDMKGIAECFEYCFPNSIAVLLGRPTVTKSLEWFLLQENRQLVHLVHMEKIIGFQGCFIPQYIGDGAKSGMLRHAFLPMIRGFLFRPHLLFHPEVKAYLPSFIKNVFLRLKKRKKVSEKICGETYLQSCIIATVGVLPEYRGNGFAEILLKEAELFSKQQDKVKLHLCVKDFNDSAIRAYKKAGWTITSHGKKNFQLDKVVD